jgi:hypothetical protein
VNNDILCVRLDAIADTLHEILLRAKRTVDLNSQDHQARRIEKELTEPLRELDNLIELLAVE